METHIIWIYSSLLVSVITLFLDVKLFGKAPLWMVFLILAFGSAVLWGRASSTSLLYSIAFGCAVYFYFREKNLLLFGLVVVGAIPLYYHFSFVGFTNYQFLQEVTLSKDSIPYNLYFNLDKPLIGIFILGFGLEYLDMHIRSYWKLFFIEILLMVVLFFVLASVLGYSRFDPKLPSFILIWMLCNFFSTCLAEEALFRGFMQKEISMFIKKRWGVVIAIAIASVVFGLSHYKGGGIYIGLATLAGVFYGYAYFKTKKVLASMVLHFSFNLLHILFFAYPALR